MSTRPTQGRWQGVAAAVVALALAACSGGGGDGDAGVVYTGVTTPAAVTDANAMELTSTAYQGGNSGGAFAFIGVATDETEGAGATAQAMAVTRVLEDAVRAARFNPNASDQVAVGATQSMSGQLDPGNCGGTASFSGTADDVTGEFHATFTFSAWCNDGVTVSGRVTASGQIDVSTEELVELEFSFSVLTVSDGTDTFRGSGSILVSFGTSESMTITMDFASGDGTTYRVSNLAITAETDLMGVETVTVSGRVYHPVHGYVDVSTPTPLVVQAGETFPSSGELVVTGDAGSKARLTAQSPTQFQLEVDQDGDDFYETDLGTFSWDTV